MASAICVGPMRMSTPRAPRGAGLRRECSRPCRRCSRTEVGRAFRRPWRSRHRCSVAGRRASLAPQQRQLGPVIDPSRMNRAFTRGEHADHHRVVVASLGGIGDLVGDHPNAPLPTTVSRPAAISMVSVTRRSRVLSRDRPSIAFATHTDPSPTATPAAPFPTLVVAVTSCVSVSIRDDVIELARYPHCAVARGHVLRDEIKCDSLDDVAARRVDSPQGSVVGVSEDPDRVAGHRDARRRISPLVAWGGEGRRVGHARQRRRAASDAAVAVRHPEPGPACRDVGGSRNR